MTRTLIGICAAILVSAALIGAQQTPPQQPPPDQQQQQQAQPPAQPQAQAQMQQQNKEKTVTWVGCLEAGTQPGTFVLRNAVEEKESSAAGAGAYGANPPAGGRTEPPARPQPQAGQAAQAKGMTLKLAAGTATDFDLTTNLNHKVQVSGTIADAAIEPAAQPTAQPPAGAARSADQPTKTLTIKSAKSLADRCTALPH